MSLSVIEKEPDNSDTMLAGSSEGLPVSTPDQNINDSLEDEGTEADEEWSDEEHNNTITEVPSTQDTTPRTESTPQQTDSMNMTKTKHKKSATIAPTPHFQASNPHHQAAVLAAALASGGRYDGTDFIMDRIDQEMHKMGKSPKKKKPSRQERQQLRSQGVEFDTGDETSGGVDTRQALRDGLAKLKNNKGSAHEKSTTDGDDTGLGTASLQDDSDTGGGGQKQQPQIVGKVDIYQTVQSEESTEEEDGQGNSSPAGFELDSDVARQLDNQYKQILSKKSESSGQQSTPKRSSKRKDSLTDHDSIRTEDIAAEYQKTLVPTFTAEKPKKSSKPKKQYILIDTSGGKARGSAGGRVKSSGVKSSTPTARVLSMPMNGSKTKKKKAGRASDVDSVMTEDYENLFNQMLVKQVASVPITSFDQMMVDSDLDTVRSHIIRDKLRAPYQGKREESEEEEEEESSCEEDSDNDNAGTMETVIQKQFQEMMKRGMKTSASWEPSTTSATTTSTSRLLAAAAAAANNHPAALASASQSTSLSSASPAAAMHLRNGTSPLRFSSKSNRYPGELATDSRTSFGELSLDEDAKEMERESSRIRQETERALKTAAGVGKSQQSRVSAVNPFGASVLAQGGQYGAALNALQAVQVPSESDSSGLGPDQLNSQLFKLNAALNNAKKEKFTMTQELKSTQQALSYSRLEIKNLEQQIKQNRAIAENVRTELMLAEFQRDSSRKEHEKLQADITARRHQLRELEEEEHTEETNRKTQHEQQLQAAMAEREELVGRIKSLESQVVGLESKERERCELERQLSATKEDLFAEQKRARTHMDTIKEELEQKAGRVEELLTDKNKMQASYNKLEAQYKQMETDKNAIIKEKSEEYEEMKTRTQEQMVQSRSNNSQESTQLRQQLHEVTARLSSVNVQINRSEELNLQLREQLLDIQQQLSEEKESKAALVKEHQTNINTLHNQQDSAVKQAQFEAEQDKQKAVESVREEMSQQSQQQVHQTESRLKQTIAQLEDQLMSKEVELSALIDKVRQQEIHTKKYTDQLRQESQERLLECLREERGTWEQEKETETRHVVTSMREETERIATKLRSDLDYERDLVEKQKRQISSLSAELEETREANRQAYRDKLNALDKMKETAELEKERELDFVKEKIEKETQRSLERLRDTISRQEEELQRLRAESNENHQRATEATASAEHLNRQAVKDVNEACRLMAAGFAVMPRTVNLGLYNGWSGGQGGGKSALSAAIQNLRATAEEGNKIMAQLRHDAEANKEAVLKADRVKSDELEALKHKLHTEKIQALESLKDRLIKEHLGEVDKLHKSLGKDKSAQKALREKDNEMREIQRNMSTWKSQQTEKLARKFQEEMNRELEKRTKDLKANKRDWEREKATHQREVDRLERELQHVRMNASLYSRPPSPAPRFDSASSASSTAQTRQLQNQVKQLQLENSTLRRSRSLAASSVPDLSVLNRSFTGENQLAEGRKIAHFESQIQQLETKARLSEDRAKKNDQLLNQKMLEMSKLQSTLTQQTKELMQLERAYSQLQHKTTGVSPRVSFAR